MKTLNILIAFIFSLTTFSVSAQAKTSSLKKETVKVYGNCGMCKTRIEKAAKLAGASIATWNSETQMLAVSYAPSKSTLQGIEEKVASVGHDTQNATANNEAYNGLHGCCKYERKVVDEVAKASCCKVKENCTKDDCCKPTAEADCCKAGSTATCCSDGKSCCSK